MRFSVAYFLAAVAVALLFAPSIAAANSEKASDLAEVEATGLRATGAERLNALLASAREDDGAVPPGGEVTFSRSWIDAQPQVFFGKFHGTLPSLLLFCQSLRAFSIAMCRVAQMSKQCLGSAINSKAITHNASLFLWLWQPC